jgi:hypothetical protein
MPFHAPSLLEEHWVGLIMLGIIDVSYDWPPLVAFASTFVLVLLLFRLRERAKGSKCAENNGVQFTPLPRRN